MRPMVSAGPPAPNGTTSVIGRDGYDCAHAVALAANASANANASRILICILPRLPNRPGRAALVMESVVHHGKLGRPMVREPQLRQVRCVPAQRQNWCAAVD